MAAKSPALHISLTESPDAAQGVSLVAKAQGIIIRDKASHEACREFLKGAKALKRSIEDHYAAIKKPLNEARNTVLDMEKKHLAPVLQAIALAEKYDTDYVREQRRIEEEQARKKREALEAEERARREKEADAAEALAIELEASSNVLSAREQEFVSYYLASDKTPRAVLQSAKQAGYKDWQGRAALLMKSEKINQAIANAVKAQRIRQESEAKQAAPVLVETPVIESKIGAVSGTTIRTYYSCQSFDMQQILTALAERRNPMLAAELDRYVRPALQSFLDAQARQLKELFPKTWPSATLGKRDGVTG